MKNSKKSTTPSEKSMGLQKVRKTKDNVKNEDFEDLDCKEWNLGPNPGQEDFYYHQSFQY